MPVITAAIHVPVQENNLRQRLQPTDWKSANIGVSSPTQAGQMIMNDLTLHLKTVSRPRFTRPIFTILPTPATGYFPSRAVVTAKLTRLQNMFHFQKIMS